MRSVDVFVLIIWIPYDTLYLVWNHTVVLNFYSIIINKWLQFQSHRFPNNMSCLVIIKSTTKNFTLPQKHPLRLKYLVKYISSNYTPFFPQQAGLNISLPCLYYCNRGTLPILLSIFIFHLSFHLLDFWFRYLCYVILYEYPNKNYRLATYIRILNKTFYEMVYSKSLI